MGVQLKVGIVGVGHVGLPTAAALAHVGHEVVAYDADAAKLAALAEGRMPFFEPGMEELVRAEMEAGRLSFSHEAEDVVSGADVVFICVGTPPRESGEANLVAIEQAAEWVARHATQPFVLVQKSTVPAGTASRLVKALTNYRAGVRFDVVSNPEFLREGSAIADSLQPVRILVGSDSDDAIETMHTLYAPFLDKGTEWIATDVRTAELAKHACNAFLAMKISFANALARISELSGADVVAVADAMGSDPRIGRSFLDAGLGYGGYCFPKDLSAFEKLAQRLGYDFGLLREVAKINEEAVTFTFLKIEEAMWNLEEKKIALLGLAFKPGTDDVRFSPALVLGSMLLEEGARVVGYDPAAGPNAKAELPGLELAESLDAALEDANCAVICTDWDEFKTMDLPAVRSRMAFPILVDARNALDPAAAVAAGLTYLPTGRPATIPAELTS